MQHNKFYLALFISLPVFWIPIAWAAPDPTVLAQPVSAQAVYSPKFSIKRFDIVGNTLLPAADIERQLMPYSGENKTFADIQLALEALQKAYSQAGYGAVLVRLPEQAVEQGVVRFVVIESKVGRILVEGSRFHDDANILASVPSLRIGATPRVSAIEANLKVANENPSKKSQVFLKASDQPAGIDATIKVSDERPWRAGAIFDNTGNAATGETRLGVFYQHHNVANRDQVLTLQYTASPAHLSDVTIFGAGYHIPLYDSGDSVDLFAGYADVDSGTLQNLFSVNGKGSVFGARYSHNLPRHGDYDHKLVAGIDYRDYRNNVQFSGTGSSLVPDVTVQPFSLAYVGQWHIPLQRLSFYLSGSSNVPGGTHGSSADFAASRSGASAHYTLLRFGADFNQGFGSDWQIHLGFSGQSSADALVAGEQFGIGGAASVRGFHERELAGDSGMRASVELIGPDFGARMGPDIKARGLVFYDYGSVSRNQVLPGEATDESIASAGVGVRLNIGKNWVLQADAAQVIDAGGTESRGDARAHFSIVWVY